MALDSELVGTTINKNNQIISTNNRDNQAENFPGPPRDATPFFFEEGGTSVAWCPSKIFDGQRLFIYK